MLNLILRMRHLMLPVIFVCAAASLTAQTNLKPRYNNSTIYTGIEVGSKGVKLSVIEIGKNAKSNGSFHILKDSSVNTDFISFTDATSAATLQGLLDMYYKALKEYKIPSKRIFTVISSGVKGQAEKDNKNDRVKALIDSFRLLIGEPNRLVEVVDVTKEARLSHLGIVPDSRRFNTFLIDIGSGNTKGGFFPYGNTEEFKLFQLNWGTKSVANAAEKRLEGDNSLVNFNKHMYRVLAGAENSEIIYAVNSSGAYPLSDNIAVSGGIAWAVATLTHPELVENPIVSISFEELKKFCDKVYNNYNSLSASYLAGTVSNPAEKEMVITEVNKVHKVFDQRSLMSGAGLLQKVMRQFESVFDTKHFYLVKNGQVGWVSAYVDNLIEN